MAENVFYVRCESSVSGPFTQDQIQVVIDTESNTRKSTEMLMSIQESLRGGRETHAAVGKK